MFLTVKLRRIRILPALLLFLAAFCVLAVGVGRLLRAEPVRAGAQESCLVIDPGHGGCDGGAVSMGGQKESGINLAISLRLQQLAELYGVRTVMTRDSDRSADQSSEPYSEHRDLVARTEIANAIPNAVLISVHQNFYPTSGPSGAQVLYAPGEESEALGRLTHGNLVRLLDPQNRRVAAPAPKSLYVTAHVNCPAILVECGFMSNFEDLDKLLSEKYQTSLALVLAGSYLQFISEAEFT